MRIKSVLTIFFVSLMAHATQNRKPAADANQKLAAGNSGVYCVPEVALSSDDTNLKAYATPQQAIQIFNEHLMLAETRSSRQVIEIQVASAGYAPMMYTVEPPFSISSLSITRQFVNKTEYYSVCALLTKK